MKTFYLSVEGLEKGLSAVASSCRLVVGKPCLLCHQPSDWSGVFVPSNPRLWGGKLGSSRAFVYPLCSSCKSKPGREDLVEMRIMQNLVGNSN